MKIRDTIRTIFFIVIIKPRSMYASCYLEMQRVFLKVYASINKYLEIVGTLVRS